MIDKNVLLVEEQALHEQEQGLVHMEAQLHTQEQGIAQMERAFLKKTKALLNHASYVKEQETSLLRRAEAMGPRARALAIDILNASDSQIGAFDGDLGRLPERQALLQRRKELMSSRMALLEERESMYAARSEALENAESQVGDLEQKLVRRESAVSETARKVFAAASNLEDDDDEPAPVASYASVPRTERQATAPIGRQPSEGRAQTEESPSAARVRAHTPSLDQRAQLRSDVNDQNAQSAVRTLEPGMNGQRTVPLAGRAPAEASHDLDTMRDGEAIAGEPMRVASGEVDQEGDDDSLGGVSRAEDRATRKRASARARVRTNQFKITLEAHLDATEPHHFFRYENDGPADLPGLFIATPNLLKVGREVRIRVGRAGQFLEATGIVAWRRQRGDTGGTPGMGIELLNLSEPERNLVGKWIKDKAPVTI